MSETDGMPAAAGQNADAGAATGAARDAVTGQPGATPGTAATGTGRTDPSDLSGRHLRDQDSAGDGSDLEPDEEQSPT